MIRPAHFGPNPATAATNFFQREDGAAAPARALAEFDSLALALAAAGVRVHELAGRSDTPLPDEIFPNNWLSLHADGTVVLYPMLAENRRHERRQDIISALSERWGYRVERVVDLTALEERGEYLEGTGSVVLDRERRLAFACWSPRTTAAALAEFERRMDYEALTFHAADASGRAIYHTNVLLSLGSRFAVVCAEAIAASERRRVLDRIEATRREIVTLGFAELDAFAGNLLELMGRDGPVIALSARALAALSAPTRRALERHGSLVVADVATIEALGGGSVRCMLAEVALPRAGTTAGENQ